MRRVVKPRQSAQTSEEMRSEPGILAALGLCRKDRLRSPVADRVSGDGRTRWAEIINLQGRRSARSDGERPWRRPSPDRAGRTEAVEGVCPLCERHAPLAQGRDGLWRRGPEAQEAARRRGAAGSRTAQILQGFCGVDGMDEAPLSARAP